MGTFFVAGGVIVLCCRLALAITGRRLVPGHLSVNSCRVLDRLANLELIPKISGN